MKAAPESLNHIGLRVEGLRVSGFRVSGSSLECKAFRGLGSGVGV